MKLSLPELLILSFCIAVVCLFTLRKLLKISLICKNCGKRNVHKLVDLYPDEIDIVLAAAQEIIKNYTRDSEIFLCRNCDTVFEDTYQLDSSQLCVSCGNILDVTREKLYACNVCKLKYCVTKCDSSELKIYKLI